MGITLGILISGTTEVEQRPYLVLEDEVLEYLSKIADLPSIHSLGNADPYGDTHIPHAKLTEILSEIGELLDRVDRRQVADPPELIGLEGGRSQNEGETFGWGGLRVFLEKLRRLIGEANNRGKDLLAVGD